jgi:hypothetical protein
VVTAVHGSEHVDALCLFTGCGWLINKIENLFFVDIHLLIVTNTTSIVYIMTYIHRKPREIIKSFA